MPAFSFRIKLLLAMMAVVAGVTGATLFATQQKVHATYQRLFQQQFLAQLKHSAELRESRLEGLQETCRQLASHPRVFATLEEEELDILYDTASDQLGMLPGQRLRSIVEGSSGSHGFLCFLDADGRVLHPEEGSPLARTFQRKLERQLPMITTAMGELERQQVGFLALEGDSGKTWLQEVVVTLILDPISHEPLGALAVGLKPPAEQAGPGGIMTGMLLEDRIYSQSIPERAREPLAGQIAQQRDGSNASSGDFLIKVQDKPFRVFYRALNEASAFPKAYQVGLYSLEPMFAEQREMRWKIMAFGAVALAGGLFLSLLLSHGLAVPIRELSAATVEIQRGNFAIKVPVRSRDEVGRLTESFNEMTEGLALKEKYRNVLNMVADEKVAEKLMTGQVALGGEVREISVLFCDIRGFTALTQDMPPAEVIQMLNEHMTALTRVVYEHHGVVDKFVGDLIMAVFGAPESSGHDSQNAVRCALRMVEERRKLNHTSHHKIEMGIGVATGEAVAGCMGSMDRLNYTVLGERVNLAARLCSKARPMEVVIDAATRGQLPEAFNVAALPELQLKGFSEAVRAYTVRELQTTQPINA